MNQVAFYICIFVLGVVQAQETDDADQTRLFYNRGYNRTGLSIGSNTGSNSEDEHNSTGVDVRLFVGNSNGRGPFGHSDSVIVNLNPYRPSTLPTIPYPIRPTLGPTTCPRKNVSGCKYWCRTASNAYYCCENVKLGPGKCPAIRPECPVFTRSTGPRACCDDCGCPGIQKCCYDTCLGQKVCKTPIPAVITYNHCALSKDWVWA